MKNQQLKNKRIDAQGQIISGSVDGGEFHLDDNCPICRLIRDNPDPSYEQIKQAFKEAEEEGGHVGYFGDEDATEES